MYRKVTDSTPTFFQTSHTMRVIGVESHAIGALPACRRPSLMSLNTQRLGNGERFSTWFCGTCLNRFRSAYERKPDHPDQPGDTEPGEHITDRSIDRMYAPHGDVRHHHLGIGVVVK